MLQLLNEVNAAALARAYRQFPAKLSTLDLDFLNNRGKVAGVDGTALAAATATRSTTATYLDSAGVLQTAAINEPILFEYDPVLRRPLGLRILGQSRNEYLNSATLSTQSVAVTAQPYTVSFIGTGTITLSGVSTAGPLVGVDANTRVSLTFTPTAGTLVSTVSGTVSNAQLQAGTLFDSYIPTEGSAVTRAADVISFTGSNFSSWYNQSGGVFLIHAKYRKTDNAVLLNAVGPTIDNRHQLKNNAPIAATVTGGTVVSEFYSTLFASDLEKRIVYQYADNDFSLAQNGIITNTDNSGLAPTNIQSLELGRWGFAGLYLDGYIERLTYFPNRLPNNIRAYLSKLL